MKESHIKAESALLACSMLIPLAACNRPAVTGSTTESESGQKISADDPWFNCREFAVDSDSSGEVDIDSAIMSIAGVDDNYIVAQISVFIRQMKTSRRKISTIRTLVLLM